MNKKEYKEFENVTKKREELESKLEKVLKKKAKVQQNRLLQLKPVIYKKFRNQVKSYDKVNSKCDYNLIMTHKEKKEEEMKKQKEDFEMADCTFRPKILDKSNQMVKDHVVVYKRELPKKKEDPVEEIPEKLKTNAKLNPLFYEQKLEWKNKKYEITQKKRVDKTLEEIKTLKDPETNKKINEKIVKRDKDFLKRVQNDLATKTEKQNELEKMYYTLPFKPKINTNIDVEPKVWNQSQLYESLKRKHKLLQNINIDNDNQN
jgi:hypothetical protein